MLLKDIPFPKTEQDQNSNQLNNRLKQIRNQIYGSNKTKEFSAGRYVRHVINAENFGWINEIQIEAETKDGENFLVVQVYAGDTKQQG